METVIVLGAKGRFGRASVDAFLARGWRVKAFGRNWPDDTDAPNVVRIEGDVTDTAALIEACKGCAVIVNAINPPYADWSQMLPSITKSVISAAKATNATVLIPGNVYNYGANMPAVLTETTPHRPTTGKGQLREQMEQEFHDAGVSTIILRGGDFIEAARTGIWFDSIISPKSYQGKTTYPGPLAVPHAWAYLPDMARAGAMLAERRHQFETFETFGFAGFGISGEALVTAIEQATGKTQKVNNAPWRIIWLLGLFNANMREVREMRYLWDVAHVIDGAKLARVIPNFEPTPLQEAIQFSLGDAL